MEQVSIPRSVPRRKFRRADDRSARRTPRGRLEDTLASDSLTVSRLRHTSGAGKAFRAVGGRSAQRCATIAAPRRPNGQTVSDIGGAAAPDERTSLELQRPTCTPRRAVLRQLAHCVRVHPLASAFPRIALGPLGVATSRGRAAWPRNSAPGPRCHTRRWRVRSRLADGREHGTRRPGHHAQAPACNHHRPSPRKRSCHGSR